MMSSVPQFIDIEDKIAGPLTWKQLGWMIGMGAAILLIFGSFETVFAIILSIPTAMLFLAFAFYKPNGLSMTSFIGHSVLFVFRPKVAVWERPIPSLASVKVPKTDQAVQKPEEEKQLNHDKLKELARIMDRRQ